MMNPESQWNPGIYRRGVSSAGTKGASGSENGYCTVRRLRKTAVAGRNGLAKPLPGKKIA
jgi:hypothetical protein